MLIGFTGPIGSGKTTAARMIKGANILPFAGAMKKNLQELFMFTDDQMYTLLGKNTIDPRWGVTPREVMQKFGTDFIRTHFPDFWVKRMAICLSYYSYRDIVVIDDVRFGNEAELVRRLGGTIGHITGRRAEVDDDIGSHSSEQGVQFMIGDAYIDNSGTLENLKRTVDHFLNYEIGEAK